MNHKQIREIQEKQEKALATAGSEKAELYRQLAEDDLPALLRHVDSLYDEMDRMRAALGSMTCGC